MWGLSLDERLRRAFARQGLATVTSESDLGSSRTDLILVQADAVIDAPLIGVLKETPGLVLMSSAEYSGDVIAAHATPETLDELHEALARNRPPSTGNFEVKTPAEVNAAYWQALRKKETPYALRVTAENEPVVSWRMFMGTYKGATDLVTKHVWPVPAYYATRWLAARNVTPNMVTTVAAIATALAFVLFLNGWYLTGLLAAWAMTFFDTVDGKLARTTLTSSRFGDIFDHGIDLVHPPFWYLAWLFGLTAWGIDWPASTLWLIGGVILGSYVLQRVMEGLAIWLLGIEIHIWRPIDTAFRQITARRNPNLVILTAATLMARPDWGIVAVAWWSAICLVLHGIQLLHALIMRSRIGKPLTSWMRR